jgi:hypothetical protein
MFSKRINFLLFIILPFIIFAQNNDSLVAHYKLSRDYFDNQSAGKFYDLSGNGNHATPSDTFQFVEDHLGNPGGAMRFDGINDYLNCGNDDGFNIGSQPWSFQAWIYINPNALSGELGNDYDACLFSKYADGNNHYGYWYAHMQARNFRLRIDGENITAGYHEYLATEPGRYHLLTFIFDFNHILIYKNGHLIHKKPLSNLPNTIHNNGSFHIGAFVNGIAWFWKGRIEEIWVYNKKIDKDRMLNIFDDFAPHVAYEDFEYGAAGDRILRSPIMASSECTDEEVRFSKKSQTEEDNTIFEAYVPEHSEQRRGRSEMIMYFSPNHVYSEGTLNEGEEWWTACYFKVDKNFVQDSNEKWNTIVQNKDAHSQEKTAQISYLNGSIGVVLNLFDKETGSRLSENWQVRRVEDQTNYSVPIEKDRWYRIVQHIVASSNTGLYEAWIDGIPLLPDTATLVVDDNIFVIENHQAKYNLLPFKTSGLQNRIGYYRGNYVNQSNSLFFDDIMIGLTAESINFSPPKSSQDNDVQHLSIEPKVIDFGTIKQNSEKMINLNLTNRGNEQIQILSCDLNNNKEFKIQNFPKLISLGEKQNIEISFNPDHSTNYKDTLTIVSNGNAPDNDTIHVEVKGIGGAPELQILQINIPKRKL